MNKRQGERTEYGREESLHLEALHETTQHEKQRPVDDESEDTECEQIDRQGEDHENRLDRDTDHSPEKSKQKRGDESLHADAGHDIRQSQKRERGNDPLEQHGHRYLY